MDFKRVFGLFMIFMLLISFSYAMCYNKYVGINGMSSQAYSTNSNYLSSIGIYSSSYGPFYEGSNSIRYGFPVSAGSYRVLYFYATDKRLLVKRNSEYCGTATDTITKNLGSFAGYFSRDLTTSKCQIQSTFNSLPTQVEINTPVDFTLTLIANLKPITSSSNSRVYEPPSLMNQYYYMNAKTKIEAINTNTVERFTLQPEATHLYKDNTKSGRSVPLGFTPTSPGTYKIRVSYDTNVESKCTLSGYGESSFVESNSFEVLAPACQISKTIEPNKNILVQAPQLEFKALPFLKLTKSGNKGSYSEIFIFPNNLQKTDGKFELIQLDDNNAFFNQFYNAIDDVDTTSLDDVVYFQNRIYGSYNGNSNSFVGNSNLFPSGIQATNEVPFVEFTNEPVILDYDLAGLRATLESQGNDWGEYTIESFMLRLDDDCDTNLVDSRSIEDVFSIQLKNPDKADEECFIDDKYSIVSGGFGIDLDAQTISKSCGACEGLKIFVNGDLKAQDSCKSGGCSVSYYFGDMDLETLSTDLVTEEDGSSDEHAYSTLKKGCSNYKIFDQEKLNKIACLNNQSQCKFVNSGEIISLPTPINENNIKIYKKDPVTNKDILIREEKPNPATIAMKGHKIQRFKNKEQAEMFVTDSVRLMEKFEIEKYLDYDEINDETKITINLNNIPASEQKDITLYQVIPKQFASQLNELTNIQSNNGQFIVLDKDPVIGWYFNDSQSNESVEYTIPGDNEGGTIIITQEPILFNEGELVVNYREASCNSGELELFQLDDLENSKVYGPNSGRLYKVCLAHVNDTISNSLELNNNNNYLHVFNYTNGENISLNKYSIPLDISTNDNQIYWNIQFSQTNPEGIFSCLGSYNSQDSSTFGDCGYTNNRIWLHLGADMEPPETKVVYPFLAHTMRVTLEADDHYGSGVENTYYCIKERDGEDCNPQIYDGKEILLQCPNQWGCVRTFKYYSTDVEGNQEEMQEFKLTLIEKGSACQADCTAKPTPNRIIKDCMNLNGCSFYGVTENEQRETSDACHYLTADTWVNNPNNPEEEILCPNGPVRKAQFTSSPIHFWDSICDNLQQASYPVVINGKQANMVFVYCEEY